MDFVYYTISVYSVMMAIFRLQNLSRSNQTLHEHCGNVDIVSENENFVVDTVTGNPCTSPNSLRGETLDSFCSHRRNCSQKHCRNQRRKSKSYRTRISSISNRHRTQLHRRLHISHNMPLMPEERPLTEGTQRPETRRGNYFSSPKLQEQWLKSIYRALQFTILIP